MGMNFYTQPRPRAGTNGDTRRVIGVAWSVEFLIVWRRLEEEAVIAAAQNGSATACSSYLRVWRAAAGPRILEYVQKFTVLSTFTVLYIHYVIEGA